MRRTSTPWGRADQAEDIAPGIVFYSTPSHGGIHLSRERLAQMPANYRAKAGKAYTPPGWFEEDCEVAFVIVTWPEHFGATSYRAAVDTLQRTYGITHGEPEPEPEQPTLRDAFLNPEPHDLRPPRAGD
jgi:hypothetical protein